VTVASVTLANRPDRDTDTIASKTSIVCGPRCILARLSQLRVRCSDVLPAPQCACVERLPAAAFWEGNVTTKLTNCNQTGRVLTAE